MKDFYVGQEVVCIKSHSQGVVIKDTVYTIKKIKESPCNCRGMLWVDVGIPSPNYFSRCTRCNRRHPASGIWWLNSALFTPLDEIADIRELTEILEQKVEL